LRGPEKKPAMGTAYEAITSTRADGQGRGYTFILKRFLSVHICS
jgi:hypothetical protein